MVHKTILTSRPHYLHGRLSPDHNYMYRTRQHSTGGIRMDQTFRHKSDLPRNSFRYRGAHEYNNIPADIRTAGNMNTFKTKLKRWIKMNTNPD